MSFTAEGGQGGGGGKKGGEMETDSKVRIRLRKAMLRTCTCSLGSGDPLKDFSGGNNSGISVFHLKYSKTVLSLFYMRCFHH